MKPRLLDLFCCAGGASVGYARAGFEVTGVDITHHPRYPFAHVASDALAYLSVAADSFDAVHASPPCQRYSSITRRHGRQDDHPDLVAATREALVRTGLPYIIENVHGAPLVDPVTLCGSMFDLGAHVDGEWRCLRRHRLFESNVGLTVHRKCAHSPRSVGVYGNPGGSSRRDGVRFAGADAWAEAMGIDWMSAKEMAEAIPPAYTEHLGQQLMAEVVRRQVERAAA